MERLLEDTNSNHRNILTFVGILGILAAVFFDNKTIAAVILMLPFILVITIYSINKPIILWFIIFILNYVIMGLSRYIDIPKVSIIMDAFLFTLLILIVVHSAINKTIQWNSLNNILIVSTSIWTIFCLFLILNPTGDTYAWFSAKNLIYNGLLVSVVTLLVVNKKKYLDYFIFTFSILTLLAVLKALIQKFIGFDYAEQLWLSMEGANTHIIRSGIRYFSFFTDAGNFGSNMGFTAFLFAVIGIYKSSKKLKTYYFAVSILSLYAMFISGTRGAVIVPMAGIMAYTVLTKNSKSLTLGAFLLLFIYVFFAHTYIGHSNQYIRRMRSAFKPTEDASFIVRLENQKLLQEHLKGRWFGEGLGLSGVDNEKIAKRFTTAIPNDSWLVKIWVETGIVGLCLYLGILITIFIKCSIIIMFKVKTKEIKGIFIGLLGGLFGLTLSSYGNPFYGQYPTHYIVYISLAIIFNYNYFENQTSKIN